MTQYPARDTTKLFGDEPIVNGGVPTGLQVMDFWRWSFSELLGNTLRGKYAEFLVSVDLACESSVREEWDAYDLITRDGITVEVKSASYLQSWAQRSHSKISFGIRPTRTWDPELEKWRRKAFRQANYYVFCVLTHKDMNTVNPLSVDQWEFYVLPTATLNAKSPEQKTISFKSLLRLNPKKCVFGEIEHTIRAFERKQLRDNA